MTPGPQDARKYLWDAKHAAERIARFIAGRDFDGYLADELLRSAVERQFEIMGEALGVLRRADPSWPPWFPTFRASWHSGTC